MDPQKVLIVEDHPVLALVLARTVCHMGHEVVGEVRTGKEVVRRALAEPVDLLIMDIRLAGNMNGIEAVARIRDRRHMPVIYASASTALLEGEQRRNTPCTAFLTKPFTPDELETAMAQLVAECSMEGGGTISLPGRPCVAAAASFYILGFLPTRPGGLLWKITIDIPAVQGFVKKPRAGAGNRLGRVG